MFGLEPDTLKVDLFYKLKATYEEPNGKFSLLFSNSALIDCHYIFPSFINALKVGLAAFKEEYPLKYAEAMKALNKIEADLIEKGTTFCDFAYDLNGVLKD